MSIKVHWGLLSVCEKLINTKVSFIKPPSCHYSHITSKVGNKKVYWACFVNLRTACKFCGIDANAYSTHKDVNNIAIPNRCSLLHMSRHTQTLSHAPNVYIFKAVSQASFWKLRAGSRCLLKWILHKYLCKAILSVIAGGPVSLSGWITIYISGKHLLK